MNDVTVILLLFKGLGIYTYNEMKRKKDEGLNRRLRGARDIWSEWLKEKEREPDARISACVLAFACTWECAQTFTITDIKECRPLIRIDSKKYFLGSASHGGEGRGGRGVRVAPADGRIDLELSLYLRC
ncbi:hypothetical protein EVAR_50050_1 [Eumeta japonica]|uniref:Uncharacterized protein n=1 Tax=Eumeta variegata TaxID=151549 RepID=A0A4C1XKP5_EUMVA|nr:hypothetical protein EVAR_50050_1 [Eumeta japonica]